MDRTSLDWAIEGTSGVLGTGHIVGTVERCEECHGRRVWLHGHDVAYAVDLHKGRAAWLDTLRLHGAMPGPVAANIVGGRTMDLCDACRDTENDAKRRAWHEALGDVAEPFILQNSEELGTPVVAFVARRRTEEGSEEVEISQWADDAYIVRTRSTDCDGTQERRTAYGWQRGCGFRIGDPQQY